MKRTPQLVFSLCFLLLAQCLAVAQDTWKKVTPNARGTQMSYVHPQLERLLSGKYEELEKEMASPSFADAEALGMTPQRGFFSTFRFEDWKKPVNWDGYFKGLDGWQAAFPKSPSSLLARSTAMVGYAWDARGNGVAGTVTENGFKLFGERLIEGLKKLDEARKLGGDKEPAYWVNLLVYCRGLQAPPEKIKEVVDEALKRFPEDPDIYYGYCVAILPRWGGDVGEWQSWISTQNKDARWGGKEMDPQLYVRILWRVYGYIEDSDGPLFENKKLSWEKAKLGLDQLCEKYPKSVYWKTVRAHMAWAAEDAKALTAAITALNGTYDSWAIAPGDLEKMLQDARAK